MWDGMVLAGRLRRCAASFRAGVSAPRSIETNGQAGRPLRCSHARRGLASPHESIDSDASPPCLHTQQNQDRDRFNVVSHPRSWGCLALRSRSIQEGRWAARCFGSFNGAARSTIDTDPSSSLQAPTQWLVFAIHSLGVDSLFLLVKRRVCSHFLHQHRARPSSRFELTFNKAQRLDAPNRCAEVWLLLFLFYDRGRPGFLWRTCVCAAESSVHRIQQLMGRGGRPRVG